MIKYSLLRELNKIRVKNEVEITSSGIKLIKSNLELIKEGLSQLIKSKTQNNISPEKEYDKGN